MLKIIISLIVLVISSLVQKSSTTCQNNILRFSETGKIKASATQVVAGDSITVTCTSQCIWQWHQFTINSEFASAGSSPMGNEYIVDAVSNEIFNCPTCFIPSQQDCSDSSQGPVKSTINVTFTASGVYHFQCRTSLFQFGSQYWPNNVIEVYSKILQVQVQDKPASSAVTTSPTVLVSPVPSASSIKPFLATTTSSPKPSTTIDAPVQPTLSTDMCTGIVTTTLVFATVTVTESIQLPTMSASKPTPQTEPSSFSVETGGVSQDGCDSSSCKKLLSTDTLIVIVVLSVFSGLLLLVTVLLVMVLCCCCTFRSSKRIEIFDKVLVVSESPPHSTTSTDSDISSLGNRINRT